MTGVILALAVARYYYLTKGDLDKGHMKYINEKGRVGYLVLWLMGAPFTLLLVLWVIFGNNLIGKG